MALHTHKAHHGGRYDDPHGHTAPTQSDVDQHTIAHADGFTGPRIGEVMGGTSPQEPKRTVRYKAKGWNGGLEDRMQLDPASDYKPSSRAIGSMVDRADGGREEAPQGTHARMADLDNITARPMHHDPERKMFQHKPTGNLVEVGRSGLNQFGTTAGGRGLNVSEDYSLSGESHKRGTTLNQVTTDKENWTDVSDTIRNTPSYSTARYNSPVGVPIHPKSKGR